jgi:AbrB family looped-hinge helix DNA binding protein
MSKIDALSARVRVNKQGRVVIPAAFRQALGITPGEELIARVEAAGLVLEKFETVERRLLARFAHLPSKPSVVDELLAERREAARREAEEMAEWQTAHPTGSS